MPAGIVAFALATPWRAFAQPSGANIDLQAFRPAMDSRGFITLNASEVLGHRELSFGLVTNWGKSVLRFEDGDDVYEVSHLVTPTLIGAFGLNLSGLELELGASVPFTIMSGDREPDARDDDNLAINYQFDGQGIGDVGLHLKWRVLDGARFPVGLAVIGSGFLPTASEKDSWLGNDRFTPQVTLAVDRRIGDSLRVGINGGYLHRTGGEVEFRDDPMAMPEIPTTGGVIRAGSALPFGAALSYALSPGRFDLVGETFGALPLAGENYFPLEAAAGIKVYLARNSFLSLGGGAGFLPDRGGNPALRAFVGIVFEPKTPERSGGEIKIRVAEADPPRGPEDDDGDGILNHLDRCPDDPEDIDGFEDRDGCPDPDNDGDGILDIDDLCPDDPEDVDQFEDRDGCPEIDNDVDQVVDLDDKCPGTDKTRREKTQETWNMYEDEDGCPDRKSLIDVNTSSATLREIHFEYDSAVIKKDSYKILQTVAKALLVHQSLTRIEVQGHTDERGSDAYNLDLSNRRAAAVVDFLVERGVDRKRLESHGYGERMPVDRGHGPSAWTKNRRVEFLVLERRGE